MSSSSHSASQSAVVRARAISATAAYTAPMLALRVAASSVPSRSTSSGRPAAAKKARQCAPV